jgi:hypothetical protein
MKSYSHQTRSPDNVVITLEKKQIEMNVRPQGDSMIKVVNLTVEILDPSKYEGRFQIRLTCNFNSPHFSVDIFPPIVELESSEFEVDFFLFITCQNSSIPISTDGNYSVQGVVEYDEDKMENISPTYGKIKINSFVNVEIPEFIHPPFKVQVMAWNVIEITAINNGNSPVQIIISISGPNDVQIKDTRIVVYIQTNSNKSFELQIYPKNVGDFEIFFDISLSTPDEQTTQDGEITIRSQAISSSIDNHTWVTIIIILIVFVIIISTFIGIVMKIRSKNN